MLKIINIILILGIAFHAACQDPGDDTFPYILQINVQIPWGTYKITPCTAVLISQTWALTTALCVSNVRLSLLSISNNDSIYIPISKVIVHPEYDMSNDAYIAIVQLSTPCGACSVIPLTTSEAAPEPDSTVTIVSWSNNNVTSSYMQIMSVDVTVITLDECNDDYQGILNTSLTDNSFCTQNYFTESSEVTFMQTGGALVQDGKLVGMIIDDRASYSPDLPSVYINMGYFINWINENLNQ